MNKVFLALKTQPRYKAIMQKLILVLIFSLLISPALAQTPVSVGSSGAKGVTIFSLETPEPEPTTITEMSGASLELPLFDKLIADTISQTKPEAGNTGEWLSANWSGRANIGASLQTGNTEQDAINIDNMLKAEWDDVHRAILKAELNIENEDDETTEDNRQLEGQYDYFFKQNWFFNSVLSFEQDDIADLDLRTTAGIGLGHQAFKQDDLNLKYTLGPTYLHEDFENGDSEDSLAARWAIDYDQKVWDDELQIFHEHELLLPTDEADNFLFESKTGARVPLIKGLLATAQIDFDWQNEPAPGIKEDDTTYSLKIGYEWD